jgi:hypothetical protein
MSWTLENAAFKISRRQLFNLFLEEQTKSIKVDDHIITFERIESHQVVRKEETYIHKIKLYGKSDDPRVRNVTATGELISEDGNKTFEGELLLMIQDFWE